MNPTVRRAMDARCLSLLGGCLLLAGIGLAAVRWPLYLAVGTTGLLVGGLIFFKPYLGTALVILTFPFLSSMPRGAYLPGLKLDEVLIVACLANYLLVPWTRKRWRPTPIDYAYLAVYLAGALPPILGALLRGHSPDWGEPIALLKPYILYRLVAMTVDSRRRLTWVVSLLLLGSLPVVGLAVLQLLDVAGMRALLSRIYYDAAASALIGATYLYRATASLGNWNALGGYAALGACLSLALMGQRQALRAPWLAPLALGANLSLLMLAGSSSSIVGFAIGALTGWMLKLKGRLRKRHGVYLLLALLVGSLAFAVAGRDVLQRQWDRQFSVQYIRDWASGQIYPTYGFPASVVIRWALAQYLFELMVKDRLACLVGFGTGPDAVGLLPWGTAESGYVNMLFFYGPLFILAYLALYGAILAQARRIGKRLERGDALGRALTMATTMITAAMVVMNVIHPYYSAAGVTHYFWTVVGCMLALPKIYPARSAASPPGPWDGAHDA